MLGNEWDAENVPRSYPENYFTSTFDKPNELEGQGLQVISMEELAEKNKLRRA
jgi:hypothetical protein